MENMLLSFLMVLGSAGCGITYSKWLDCPTTAGKAKKSMKGEEVARELIQLMSTELGIHCFLQPREMGRL